MNQCPKVPPGHGTDHNWISYYTWTAYWVECIYCSERRRIRHRVPVWGAFRMPTVAAILWDARNRGVI